VARARVVSVPPAFLRPGAPHELLLPMRATGVYPIAVFDHAGGLWSALVEGTGSCLIGVATEPVSRKRSAVVLRALHARRVGVRTCDRPRCRHRMIPDATGTGHRICVYLPPDYGRAGRRHPVVFMLPGFGEDEGARFQDQDFVDAIDANPGGDGPAPVLVGIDTRAPYGAAYLTDADTAWARYLTRDVITAVEAEFDVATDWRRRVLMGQGTGGFNAVRLALTAPGIYGTIAASAPDALDLESWLLSPGGAVKQIWASWIRLEDAVDGRGPMRSYATSWAPTAAGTPLWPIDLETGRTRYDVLRRWLQQSPLRLIERPEAQRALAVLEGRLFLSASHRDEFGLFLPTRRFSERLTARGIDHQFLADEGSHFDAGPRFLRLLALALARV
jgi:hypothetical protein